MQREHRQRCSKIIQLLSARIPRGHRAAPKYSARSAVILGVSSRVGQAKKFGANKKVQEGDPRIHLTHEVARLEAKQDILKSRGLLREEIDMKLVLIAKRPGIWPAERWRGVLGVSRGGFYAC